MKLHKETNCAVCFLSYLACHNRVVPSRDISDALGFSKQTITSAGYKLKEKGYIQTFPGPFGGYTLAKAPADINVQEVLLSFGDELQIGGENMPQKDSCSAVVKLEKIFEKHQEDFKQAMSSLTLADLIKDEK